MPIEPDKIVGKELPPGAAEWDEKDVILYNLGIGAGVPPTDERELDYVYEGRALKVLPSFGVLSVFSTLGGLVGLEGLSFNPMMLLHGEHDIEIHKQLPVRAKVETSAKIAHCYDKGKAALLIVETGTRDEVGDLLAVNRFASFIRGEGGFGGDSGPKPGNEAPERDPDIVVESPTLPQQAILYRLSGDRNPLHIDPKMAAIGGFDRPILHGLCSYGIVCKAAVDHALGGDVAAVKRYQARFSGVVFPGETIVTSMWNEGGTVILAAKTKERDSKVITNAAITVRS